MARLIPPGKVRDALNGVWLGHPLHPVLVQAPVGAWLSASVVDFAGHERAARQLVAAGLLAAVPAAVAGAADWSEQHEQQMRVGVVHTAANIVASSLYGASLLSRGPRLSRALRLAWRRSRRAGCSAAISPSASQAAPITRKRSRTWSSSGWHHLAASADLPEGTPVRQMLGEVPVVAIRAGGAGCAFWPTGAATCRARCPTASWRTAA